MSTKRIELLFFFESFSSLSFCSIAKKVVESTVILLDSTATPPPYFGRDIVAQLGPLVPLLVSSGLREKIFLYTRRTFGWPS